ncbi:MAG TPA: 2OG-Fe dioxygenase family protein [Burkholderiaceae bacterium]|nr:2OG-Fe dioxygenase family protein [Burkholderiaceae bacterium]
MNPLLRNAVRRDDCACPGVSQTLPDFQFLSFVRPDYERAGIRLGEPAWEELRASFFDLPVDTYLADGGSYRRRRFGRFSYDTTTGNLVSLADKPFFQAPHFNRMNGGIQRRFAPLSAAIRQNRALRQLVRFHANALRLACPDIAQWKVYVHQIRITASADHRGKPAPEGVHQDGHYFVAQVLIARENVTGAESRILSSDKDLIARTTLTQPLDTLLVNDRAVFHEVTEIEAQAGDKSAYRDMLLIDFNPYDNSDEI